MKTVKVNLKKKIDHSYNIFIGRKIFNFLCKFLEKNVKATKYAIICDSNVKKIIVKKFLEVMKRNGLKASIISFPAGEENKSLKTYSLLQENCLENGIDRKSAIVALGGGISGDLAGFVAATFMRGIQFIQVPTTLTAMVDSSIGGKTAVNLEKEKNTVGAFYQPKAVFIDVSLLKSLPKKEMRNGLAEAIKHAIIADEKYFSFIEKNLKKIFSKNENILTKLVYESCLIKAKIVEKDEKEKNLRQILNYGHTIGHAIESISKYSGISHGEAIAAGMNFEGEIAEILGYFAKKDLERQRKILIKTGFSIHLPKPTNRKKLVQLMRLDKKNIARNIFMTLPKTIGKMKTLNGKYAIPVSEKTILKALK
ncbi:MAG: 3-dehydroquinate synthase [Candidatus Diapherotrites archaeon]